MDQYSHDHDVFATFDDPAAGRGGSRDSLLLSAQLRLPVDAEPATVRVRNLSPGGLMAEFSGRTTIDQPVKIDIRGIGWVDGRVAWVAEGRLGIAFDRPVDPLMARKPVQVVSKPVKPAQKVRSIL